MQSQLQAPWKQGVSSVRAVRSRLEANRSTVLVNTTSQEPRLGVHTLGLKPQLEVKQLEGLWRGEGATPSAYIPPAVGSHLGALGDAAVDTGHRNCPAVVS